MHHLVPSKIIDDRVACLHGMQNAIRLRPVKHRSQFHEMMAAAPGVETVNRDHVSLIALQRASIGKAIEVICDPDRDPPSYCDPQ